MAIVSRVGEADRHPPRGRDGCILGFVKECGSGGAGLGIVKKLELYFWSRGGGCEGWGVGVGSVGVRMVDGVRNFLGVRNILGVRNFLGVRNCFSVRIGCAEYLGC